MRALMLPIVLGALATSAQAQPREIIGYAGYLGEWELTATVTENASWLTKNFSGPLTMRHVGLCTQDGPEEKSGELRFQLSAWSPSRLTATLLVDGIECAYSGTLSDSYSGMLICPGRQTVPLKLWVR